MSEGISKQNKDICFKILAENFKDVSLKIFNLGLPPIKRLLPTNLPSIQLDEKRADNVFLLEDDSILLLEYESKSDRKNLLKYGHYAFRIMETHYSERHCKIIMVVVYTGDVQSAPNNLDMGSVRLDIEQVFLSKYDGQKMYEELQKKVIHHAPLNDEDVMKFIILPLTEKNNKQDLIEKSIELAKKISDEEKQDFIIAGIVSATDKFIDQEYSNRIKEALRMTKLARLYEEEKIEAVNKAKEETREETWKEAWEEARKEAREEARKEAWKEARKEAWEESRKEMAKRMLADEMDILKIMELTGLSKENIQKLIQ